ncbi:MAG: NAD(P)-dependent oxidoreductase [Bacteroidota bacterium]
MKNSNFNILIIDSAHDILLNRLVDAGFKCEYLPKIKIDEIENIISDFQGIILRSKITLDRLLIDKAINLKFIARIGSGLENIDVSYAEKKGLICFNSPEGNRDSVAEHAVGMILNLFNNINVAHQEIKTGLWKREENRGTELMGKTIGIIGYGNTGSAFAKKLSSFSVNIIAFDKYKSGFSDNYVREVSLKTIFYESDIISLHIPLNKETLEIVNSNFINYFARNIYLINTSRGKIIKTSDLVENMMSGKILGACLDVLEYEKSSFEDFFKQSLPSEFDYLINAKNVILTPHIAGWTKESNYKLSEIIADKIINEFGKVK